MDGLAGALADNPDGLWRPRFKNGVTMPTERLSMRKIRDVLRLKFEAGLSERAISRALSLSAGAVNGYLKRARVAGLGWPLRRCVFVLSANAIVAKTVICQTEHRC